MTYSGKCCLAQICFIMCMLMTSDSDTWKYMTLCIAHNLKEYIIGRKVIPARTNVSTGTNNTYICVRHMKLKFENSMVHCREWLRRRGRRRRRCWRDDRMERTLDTARDVAVSNQTAPIIAVHVNTVFTEWTITAHGMQLSLTKYSDLSCLSSSLFSVWSAVGSSPT